MPLTRFLMLIACVIVAAGATVWIMAEAAPILGLVALPLALAALMALRLACYRRSD